MLALEDFRAIFLAAPDGYLVVDENGAIVDANPKAVAMFGFSREDLLGSEVETLVPEAIRARHRRHRGAFMGSPRARPMGVGLDLMARRKDGSDFPVEISLSPWTGGGNGPRVICAIRDVTAHRRLRNFSEGAMRASEDERRRIARELHDDTAQRLATILLRVRGLIDEDDPAVRRSLGDVVRSEVVETAEGVKRMARGLRPPELEDVGLALAVRAHLRMVTEHAGFEVDAALDDVDPYLDLTAKLALYRIIQEALSNARRHADASRVEVRLWAEEGRVLAEVRDDGRGFREGRSLDTDRGLGLVGMRERAAMAGGFVTIRSEPGGGTTVRAELPADAGEVNG